MTADLGTVLAKLDDFASELDDLSKQQADVERKLTPIEIGYEEMVDDYEAQCWENHEDRGDKLPPEKMREVLARRSISREIRDQRAVLLSRRKRLEKRIRTLSGLVDAQRSILSALKAEMQATESGRQP